MVWGRSFSGSLLKGAGLGAYALGQDQTMQIDMDIWLKAHHSEVSLSSQAHSRGTPGEVLISTRGPLPSLCPGDHCLSGPWWTSLGQGSWVPSLALCWGSWVPTPSVLIKGSWVPSPCLFAGALGSPLPGLFGLFVLLALVLPLYSFVFFF